MSPPSSLSRDISPPPRRLKRHKPSPDISLAQTQVAAKPPPSLAAVEAGRARVDNHLAYFLKHLSKSCRETKRGEPRIEVDEWSALYAQNEHEHGNLFVVHQHNHPISGVHYDLRLQFSKSSSMSFALPKGLPGNPNSKSPGRMAIETRVHNLWNHLIESASVRTGSLLIWDTGTYTVLPRENKHKNPPSPLTTDNESESESEMRSSRFHIAEMKHENEKLIEAFSSKYIRLRLTGTRLPKNYTVTLRLPSANDFGKLRPNFPIKKRKRKARQSQVQMHAQFTDSEEDSKPQQQDKPDEEIDTDVEENIQTRLTNAYPGSTNSIGSVHQRRWFLLLDRASSGFLKQEGTGLWMRRGIEDGEGFDTFFVRGRDFERSLVTGRLAKEIESDENVQGFVGRAGWVGITS